ncbi:MAG TPA: polymer-forming cytoskeletal protein [Pyrinomonadaceae bacterium]|nr:polymer-forming cytoskeletal protein [Pyrinomonadaceae bacterium]
MLRIGKNPKDQEDQEHASDKQEQAPYTTPRTYSSYQGTNTEPKPPVESSATLKAMTESETLARDIKEGTLGGFVGGGTIVTGEATFKAMLRVDGHLSGRVSSSSGTLIIGANGKVDANVEVAVAIIHGSVNGDVIATQRLELGRAAKVNGNIQTPSLVIEQGAIFEGSCKMLQMSATAEKNKKKEQPLDTTSISPISGDGTTKSTEISSVSTIAS